MTAETTASKLLARLRGGPAQGAGEDLVRRYFLMQDERPRGVEEVDIGDLDPFLRSLLFTDGTVTRALAVQTLSRVSVSRLSQEQAALSTDVAGYLETEAGEESIRRRVGIAAGSAPVLWAESHLLPDRLPPGFLGLLDGAPDGIGQSLQRVALESYRELLWFGLDRPPAWAPGSAGDTAIISRLYRLFSDRQASILISESFAVERRAGTYRLAGLGKAMEPMPPRAGGSR
jgi:chorismate-pyruvate lyase